jgi:hypothetical protein
LVAYTRGFSKNIFIRENAGRGTAGINPIYMISWQDNPAGPGDFHKQSFFK